MERIIRFRAWLGSENRMEYDKFYIHQFTGLSHYTEPYHYENEDKVIIYDCGEEEPALMQCTGLKDLKGTLIYEGDLLRELSTSKWSEENYSCFEVFFHDGDANTDYNIGFSMNRMHNHGAVCGGWIPSFKPKQVSKMIIIGNIYQNPELLPSPNLSDKAEREPRQKN